MYPITSPVTSALGPLVRFGSLERVFAPALDAFSNTAAGLIVPVISAQWKDILPASLQPPIVSNFVASARRMLDDSEMLGNFCREYAQRNSPDATTSFAIGRSPEESGLDRRRQKERLAEMSISLSGGAKTIWTPTRQPGWYLHFTPKTPHETAKAIFANGDGRCIHFSNLYADSVLFGYGWYAGAMHYMEVSPTTPLGKSRGLFLRERPENRPDWFATLARSLFLFYAQQPDPQKDVLSGRVHISGSERGGKKYNDAGKLSDDEFLAKAFRALDPSAGFAIDSEELVAGRRTSAVSMTLSGINAFIPLASIRYAFEEGQATVYRTYYRTERSTLMGETGLSEDIRRLLRFPHQGGPRTRSITMPAIR